MKEGHRHCYMAREFALQHGFIPKDAAPGFYGFSGITNLGSWPIKVGERVVELQVMLVENSYFPVILGRSFMEKRRVQTDPLDQTHIVFQDTGESVSIDIVVVKVSRPIAMDEGFRRSSADSYFIINLGLTWVAYPSLLDYLCYLPPNWYKEHAPVQVTVILTLSAVDSRLQQHKVSLRGNTRNYLSQLLPYN
jgi:hypothetical protein